MKLKTIVDAKEPLSRLVNKELPLKTAHDLWKIVMKANEQLGFYERKRISILETYGEISGDIYVSKNGGTEMTDKISELLMLDVEVSFEPVDICIREDIRLTVDEIARLEPFVNFVEE
jgi:hypothetical protein